MIEPLQKSKVCLERVFMAMEIKIFTLSRRLESLEVGVSMTRYNMNSF